MSNKKSTKRALITSLMAVVVCVVMLIGTTFAWFTDTASTSVNSIKSGTLNIVLQAQKSDGTWYDVTEDTVLEFKKAAAGEGQTILWEPGCSYELPAVKVVNKGTLALKYKIEITGIKGDAKLNDAIDWTIDGATLGEEAKLNAGAESGALTIKGTMKTTAGNEYQGLSIDGISITVTATQDTVEYDSYNNTYDENAEYPVYASKTVEVATNEDNETTNTDPIEIKTVETADEIEDDADATIPVATAEISRGTKLADNATSLTLVVKEDTVPANIKVESTEAAKTLEVDMKGLATNNEKPVIVNLFVGKGLNGFTMYHNSVAMTKDASAAAVTEHNHYYYDSDSGVVTMAVKSFSPFTFVYNAASAELEKIKKTYSDDGMNMPAGVKITSLGNGDNSFEIVLEDEEAFIYFTQVFDCAKAYEARKTALNNGEITKYPAEKDNDLNMWYAAYTGGITVKMGCDVDLKGMTVSSVKFGGNYGPNFDGCGHTIKNAKMSASSGDVGFFNGNKSVSNVTFDNFTVSATGATNVAVVAGYPTGASTNVTITNVTVKNSSVTGGRFTGAIAGHMYGANITNCTVENTVVCGQYKIGGIAGQISQGEQITGNVLKNVTVKGDNIWSGKTEFVLGKVLGCWAVKSGSCKNNTFTGGTTEATDAIGEIAEGYSVETE